MCGQVLAPARPGDHDWYLEFFAEAETIPLSAMQQGIQFSWESIAEYLQAHSEAWTTDLPFESPASNAEPWRVSRDMYQALKTVQQQYKRAHELGLPFSLGLDARYGGQAWQLQFLVDGGISPMDAIRSATSVAATLICYGDRLGTIEKGKLADLISVQGDPIRDIKVLRKIRLQPPNYGEEQRIRRRILSLKRAFGHALDPISLTIRQRFRRSRNDL